MYASGIYVTGLVPCLVKAVDFLLYKLHIFPAAVSSYLSSLHTLELHIQVHQLCTNNQHNAYLDPPLADLAEKPKCIGSVRKASICSHTYTCISDPTLPSSK